MLDSRRPENPRGHWHNGIGRDPCAPRPAERSAWQEDMAETAEIVRNTVTCAAATALSYNMALAEFAGANTLATLTFAKQLGRSRGPMDALVLSHAHASDRMRALHRHTGELAGLTQAMLDDVSRPYRTRAILAYGVVG